MSAPFVVIIPARLHSTRLPRKPLLDIAGQPMIERVWGQAMLSVASRVIIATDDESICDRAAAFGGEAVMTSPAHDSGTDRLWEVANRLNLADDAIVVNVQGDEPLIPPAVIDQVAANLAHSNGGIATLSEPLAEADQFFNPNLVKVVADRHGRALYFSRAPIPWVRDHFQNDRNSLPADFRPQRHIGIYAYRVAELRRFVEWGPAPLENLEKLEQLRFMWHGVSIHVAPACEPVPGGVDTEVDLEVVRKLLARDN